MTVNPVTVNSATVKQVAVAVTVAAAAAAVKEVKVAAEVAKAARRAPTQLPRTTPPTRKSEESQPRPQHDAETAAPNTPPLLSLPRTQTFPE